MATPQTAAAICSVSGQGEEAMALLREEQTPKDYLGLLTQKKLFPDAVRFLAHALPKREAVWWAWVCARRADPDPAPAAKAVLAATEAWTAHAAATDAGLGTPAGCAGLAAFFSGSSLGPTHIQSIPPGEYLYAKAVSGARTFAAVASEPEKGPEKFNNSIAQGLEITVKI